MRSGPVQGTQETRRSTPFSNTRNRRVRAKEAEKTLGVVGRVGVARLPPRPVLVTAQEMRTMIIPSLQERKQRHTQYRSRFPGGTAGEQTGWVSRYHGTTVPPENRPAGRGQTHTGPGLRPTPQAEPPGTPVGPCVGGKVERVPKRLARCPSPSMPATMAHGRRLGKWRWSWDGKPEWPEKAP